MTLYISKDQVGEGASPSTPPTTCPPTLTCLRNVHITTCIVYTSVTYLVWIRAGPGEVEADVKGEAPEVMQLKLGVVAGKFYQVPSFLCQ